MLESFRPEVAQWFRGVFAAPTPVQQGAWEAIAANKHSLIVAPTGSGKTLAAFLWAINTLVAAPEQQQQALPLAPVEPQTQPTDPTTQIGDESHSTDSALALEERTPGVRVLYISPLKALGVDVERNLRAPLLGIQHTAARLGTTIHPVSVGVRSGDTPQAERARQVRKPPEILITTPESLYLLLTSKARSMLTTVDTVIIDEIHAVAGTKRGVHLALSLERLEHLAAQPVQRIGLSATVRPLERVAQFLGGNRPVTIVNPAAQKQWQLDVHVPVQDMSDLPRPEQGSKIGEAVVDDPFGLMSPPASIEEMPLGQPISIWPFIEEAIFAQIQRCRSTLIFVNSRRSAERLTNQLNELATKQALAEQETSAATGTPAAETVAPAVRNVWASFADAATDDTPDIGAPAGTSTGVDTHATANGEQDSPGVVIARAHHGSVSKNERADIEAALKAGELRCVVATSSLELGIDMGAVDLVIQVESAPSVASALQRVGRAGHTVGAVSQGAFYPKHRNDLVTTAVVVSRMQEGMIEELHVPSNALDVLVQQVIAAVAMDDWPVDELFALVLRSMPYANLSRSVFDAVIDLASGVYPSTEFSDLRPRIVFDRVSGVLSARPGAQRVAVTSGGTIPDRGMFGVFLVGEGNNRRVGELDEEMVYESRVGDVFTLGASSWRIEEITRDQVLVTPAPGQIGKLPFWTGDQLGRPAELGKAIGAFRRTVQGGDTSVLAACGLDAFAKQNLLDFLAQQAEATGVVPDERTLVMERFRDELGDWRVVLHTPYGKGVNAAWALAVGSRLTVDAQPVAGDDGIVLRLPDAEQPPSPEMFALDPEEVADLVAAEVGNSALFASRFRECAARALLLPRKNPGKRAPLWQQRQRAAQLLEVAKAYPSFPIILETVRECVKDVYDVPALVTLCEDIAQRRVRIVDVVVDSPSPFASSILFSYTGAFMYEGDTPLAERRAAALALDPTLLAQLLGTVELKDLLDAQVIADVEQEIRRMVPGRRAKSLEQLSDTLRMVGPIPVDELAEYCEFDLSELEQPVLLGGRIMRVQFAGRAHVALSQDAALLRDALGVPVPQGVGAATGFVEDALEQLVGRFARTHGPFTVQDVAAAFGLGHATALTAINNVSGLVEGSFVHRDGRQWCAEKVLRVIRSRSLALARAQAAPVEGEAYARFLLQWQHVAQPLRGVDGVFAVVEQLAGIRLAPAVWEESVLPARIADYHPSMLDELTQTGEVVVIGSGSGTVMLVPADRVEAVLEDPDPETAQQFSPLQQAILSLMQGGGGFLFPQLVSAVSHTMVGDTVVNATSTDVVQALNGLLDAGMVAPDRLPRETHRGPMTSRRRIVTPPAMQGRWALSPQRNADDGNADAAGTPALITSAQATTRSVALATAWLDRYGVVTRGAIQAERVLGGFALAYKVLSSFEASGKALRGYVIEGLGAAQFSTSAVIDRLRGMANVAGEQRWPSGTDNPEAYLLAATDPANPYGAALPWPQEATEQRLSRAVGAHVVLVDGLLMAYTTRNGKHVTFLGEHDVETLARVLAVLPPVTIERIDGEPALGSPLLTMLRQAGAALSPKGVKPRARG